MRKRLLRSIVIINTALSTSWLSSCTQSPIQTPGATHSKITSTNGVNSAGGLQNNPVVQPVVSSEEAEPNELQASGSIKNEPVLQSSKPEDAETAAQPSLKNSAESTVITGDFIWSWNNPLDFGSASVVKKGTNSYHLSVSVVTLFSHHMGSFEGDFYVDGNTITFNNPEYKNIKLSFSDNSLTLDYSGDGFGGANAEPKGTYYLKNSGTVDAQFLQNLYDFLKLPDRYRHGLTDVLTYNTNDRGTVVTQELLLIRSKEKNEPNAVVLMSSLVLYDVGKKTFTLIGELDDYNVKKTRKKLEELKIDPKLFYEVLHKEIVDRFITVQMERFDNGDRTVLNQDQFKLTNDEAFYIVTGQRGSTRIEENYRNDKNIGSVFVQEVDHSDDKSVFIHEYESVRNNETDEHTSTSGWFEVDRSTGKVKNTLFEQ